MQGILVSWRSMFLVSLFGLISVFFEHYQMKAHFAPEPHRIRPCLLREPALATTPLQAAKTYWVSICCHGYAFLSIRMSGLFHTRGQFSQHAKDMRVVTLCVNHSVDAAPATRVSNRISYHSKCASRFSWAPCRTKGTAKRHAQRNRTFEPIGALRTPPARPQAVLSIHTPDLRRA